jgi:hypothetical protein
MTGMTGPTGPTGPGIQVSPTTLGNVLYANGQNFSATSTPNLFFDSVNTRVGIACNAPGYTLDVNGATRFSSYIIGTTIYLADGSASSPSYAFHTNTTNGMFYPANNNIAWSTNGVERMRILANGNVGIGCNAPGFLLDVNGASRFSGNVNLPSFTYASSINSSIRIGATSPVQTFIQWGDGSGWQYNYLGNSARTSNVMTLEDRGRVGINCNAPIYNLDIVGTTRMNGFAVMTGNTEHGDPSANGTAYAYHGGTNHSFYGQSVTTGAGTLSVYSTESNSNTRGGSVALGARSTDFGGGQQLQIQARIAGIVDGSYNGAFIVQTCANGALPTRLKIDPGGTVYFTGYTNNGNLYTVNGTGQITNTSDRRVKTNIVYMTEPATETLLALKPARFSFKSCLTETHLGFIAQDVETLIPEAVDGKKYEYQWEIHDDGTPKLDSNSNLIFTDRPRHRGFNDRPVIATLVKGFQELVDRIKVLEAKLNV